MELNETTSTVLPRLMATDMANDKDMSFDPLSRSPRSPPAPNPEILIQSPDSTILSDDDSPTSITAALPAGHLPVSSSSPADSTSAIDPEPIHLAQPREHSVRKAIGQLLSRSSSSSSLASSSGLNNKNNDNDNKDNTPPSIPITTGHSILNKYLSPFASRNSSTTSLNTNNHNDIESDESKSLPTLKQDFVERSPVRRHTKVVTEPIGGKLSIPVDERETLRSYTPTKVKETRHVYVEYDPVSKRKVLNTYEILKDLGRGQHGKVKLARDMLSSRLVAIKIVDRKSKPRLGKLSKPGSSQEDKIRKEIAIMKKCDHPHVVKLIEVLDDVTSRKIYLVLEYLEKGEIKWQTPDAKPVLKFHEAQKVFRDVILGLEYLHYQGIIHRDIKPANLLVSHDNVVKISDFGVSFASSADYAENEYELCKTAGTPAFLAPELCQTDVLAQDKEMKVDHKIDIWALGVTLFCLLFGKLPFNSESEFKLFEVINNEELQIPDKSTLVNSEDVTDFEWDMTVDLLNKLLTKNPVKRIDIPEIKQHEFFLHGLSTVDSRKYTTGNDSIKLHVSNEEVNYAVVGIGSKIKKKLVKALKLGFTSPDEYRLSSATPEYLDSAPTSASSSSKQSRTKLNDSSTRSLILSEALSPELPAASSNTIAAPASPSASHHHPSVLASLKNSYAGERRGSADLIETKVMAEGSFKKSNNAALEHILKINDSDGGSRRGSNTYLQEDRSRQSSVDCAISVHDKPRSKIRQNASFASLDSFHEDNVIDFSSYVPVGYNGTGATKSETGVKFNKVNFGDAEDTEPPRNYEPTTPSSSIRDRRDSKYSYSSISSSSSASRRDDGSVSTTAGVKDTITRSNTGNTGVGTPATNLRSKFFSLHDSSDDDDDDDGVIPHDDDDDDDDDVITSDDDTNDEDDKELMFAFGPKTESPHLRTRVMSHESNIPSAMRPASINNLSSTYDQSEYVIPASSSTVDLPEEFQHFIPEFKPAVAAAAAALQHKSDSTPVTRRGSPLRPQVKYSSSIDTIKTTATHNRVSSPLALNAPASPKATVSAHTAIPDSAKDFNIYKNHYSKEHHVIPFEKAHHLGNGTPEKGRSRHRHNSITVGLLLHGHEPGKGI